MMDLSDQMQKLIEENQILKGKLERLRITLKSMQEVNLRILNHEKDPEQRAFLESKNLVYSMLFGIICETDDHDA